MVDKEGLTKLKHTAVILYFLQTLSRENRNRKWHRHHILPNSALARSDLTHFSLFYFFAKLHFSFYNELLTLRFTVPFRKGPPWKSHLPGNLMEETYTVARVPHLCSNYPDSRQAKKCKQDLVLVLSRGQTDHSAQHSWEAPTLSQLHSCWLGGWGGPQEEQQQSIHKGYPQRVTDLLTNHHSLGQAYGFLSATPSSSLLKE